MNLTGCLTAVTGLRTAKLLCESVSMCASASMRVYESLELPSRQLCVWKSGETGNQLHVCMDCFLSLFFSLSLVLLLLQKPPAFWPTGRLFEPFPFNIFLHKVCAWFLFNPFLLRGIHTHVCECVYCWLLPALNRFSFKVGKSHLRKLCAPLDFTCQG